MIDDKFLQGSFFGEKQKPEKTPEKKSHRRQSKVVELSTKYEYRRAFSEVKFLEAMKYEKPKEGISYCFITGGDIDQLTYLKYVLNFTKVKKMMLSTWCISGEDIFWLGEQIKIGNIGAIDFYIGEIFPNTYRHEWELLNELIEETKCGRVAVFRNHSKIIAGYGEDFDFAVQTSANCNTNPRTEQGMFCTEKSLVDFYFEYFDGIISFEK